MIDPRTRLYLGIQEDNPADYLYIVLPEDALANQGVLDWIQANTPRGCVVYQHNGSVILQINNLGRKILTNAILDASIDTHGAELRGKPCIAVAVNTAILDADVPVGYSPNGQIYDEEGTVLRQKTVRELMLCIEGINGQSLILGVETGVDYPLPDGKGTANSGENGDPRGIQMDQILRFRTQFPGYYVFSEEQLALWKAANQGE